MKSKSHRLPEVAYRGEVRVAFTACIEERAQIFTDPLVVRECVEMLTRAAEIRTCGVPIYCFMPDHLHLVVHGLGPKSLPKAVMHDFKQSSGRWFLEHRPGVRWQASHYDHIIRKSDDWRAQVFYILNNPVRKGLVDDPLQYAFTGCIGRTLSELLAGF